MRFSFFSLLSLILLTNGTNGQPPYFVRTLGFTDAEHTGLNNLRFSSPSALTGTFVYGTSSRYDSNGDYFGASAWQFDRTTGTLRNLSLTDVEHTSSTGFRSTGTYYGLGNNDTLLAADRYLGGVDYQGQSTWYYHQSNQTSTRMGFSSIGYTSDTGYQFSAIFSVTSSGVALGNSWKYNGATFLGADAWMYNPATQTTTQLGFLDAEHTGNNGARDSAPVTGNVLDQIVGYSTRYDSNGVENGHSAWVFLNGTHIKLGFTDAEHTSLFGTRSSDIQQTHANGMILGNSVRFLGDSLEKGQSAWIYQPGSNTTRRLGLSGGFFTREDGYEYSGARFLTDNLLLGISDRYQFLNARGYGLWIHNIQANSTTQIGFLDSEHTANDNTQVSYSQGQNNGATLIGYSNRYSGNAPAGTTAWTYQFASGVTTKIGLTGTEHTAADGTRNNLPWFINAQGIVAGTAGRFNGGADDLGQSAWLYKPATNTTIDVSLTGATFTRDNGYRNSTINYLTNGNLAFGSADRYSGPNFNGSSLFVYDVATGQTQILNFSIRPSDGYAEAHGVYWNDAGTMLGYYELFDGMNNDLGSRAFSWSVTSGFLDLGSAVFGGLPAFGWASLNNVTDPLIDGSLLGVGLLSDMTEGQMTYMLVTVPEMSTVTLMIVAGCLGTGGAWLAWRRRKQAMDDEIAGVIELTA